MTLPMIPTEQLPKEMLAELERLRKHAQPASYVAFDGPQGRLLIVVATTPQGLQLVTPVVVAVPVGDFVLAAAQSIVALGPQFWNRKVT